MADRQSLEDFTEEERAIINDIYKRQFSNMTPEEVILYGEWQGIKARLDAELVARENALKEETAAKIQARRATEQAAIDALEALKNLAVAKLKAVENGQQE